MCLGKDSISGLLRFCGVYLKASKLGTVLGIQRDNKLNSGISVAKSPKN